MYFLIEEYFPLVYFGLAKLRAILLRFAFKKIGRDTSIQYGCFFNGMRNIEIGDKVYINHHTELLARDVGISIGNYIMIGQHTILIADNHNYQDPKTLMIFQGSTNKKIIVEDDVWIGTHVIILPGVTIGRGSIVAAGAVVTKDVEPYSIVGGVPAKLLKYRFDKETIKKARKINWSQVVGTLK
ncbi:MAG TPA: acyltransferase [Candidatus Saccharimonadales bacterium]|nr:acyltransferase [Candidatus Saccharimonadales bacterium]